MRDQAWLRISPDRRYALTCNLELVAYPDSEDRCVVGLVSGSDIDTFMSAIDAADEEMRWLEVEMREEYEGYTLELVKMPGEKHLRWIARDVSPHPPSDSWDSPFHRGPFGIGVDKDGAIRALRSAKEHGWPVMDMP